MGEGGAPFSEARSSSERAEWGGKGNVRERLRPAQRGKDGIGIVNLVQAAGLVELQERVEIGIVEIDDGQWRSHAGSLGQASPRP